MSKQRYFTFVTIVFIGKCFSNIQNSYTESVLWLKKHALNEHTAFISTLEIQNWVFDTKQLAENNCKNPFFGNDSVHYKKSSHACVPPYLVVNTVTTCYSLSQIGYLHLVKDRFVSPKVFFFFIKSIFASENSRLWLSIQSSDMSHKYLL